MLNAFQRACAATYADGAFAHVTEADQAKQVGDTLFAFLMIELASSEGCDDRDEAARRLSRAMDDIGSVLAAIDGA